VRRWGNETTDALVYGLGLTLLGLLGVLIGGREMKGCLPPIILMKRFDDVIGSWGVPRSGGIRLTRVYGVNILIGSC
jgi:hypothetical protein